MSEFRLRAPTDADVDALVWLTHTAERETGIEPTETAQAVHERWSHPRFDRDRFERVAIIDGEIAGTAHLWTEGDQAHGGGYVMPAFRGRGVGRALLEHLIETARDEPSIAELHVWTDTKIGGAVELYESIEGAEHIRTFIRMVNRHPAATALPEWPDGCTLSTFEGEELIDAVLHAHDNSFIDHWNFVPMPREDIVHDLAQPDTDPSLWFIAVLCEQIAGFNMCWIREREGVSRGYLGPIGTCRGFRNKGLARALLRHGVRELSARGTTEVFLGVDAENPNQPLGLYERNGFAVWGEGRVYRMKL